jgi:thiol-disulfide isomerase/thioredoxin
MSELFTSLIIVLCVFGLIVGIYNFFTGNFPASKLIITDPPIEHNGLEPKQARFMFFFTSWCPHCKTAEPLWRSFKQELKNNPVTYGDFDVDMEEINVEANTSKSALYKVKAYPSFKLETSKKVFEMTGIPNITNFNNFLVSALGKKIQKSSTSN